MSRASSAVRRAIILVSDGDDNESRVYRQEAVEMAQRAEVIIYTISTSLMNNHTKGDENLKALAEATGGRAFFPVKLDDVVAAFADIQDELRSQYMISYRPDQFVVNGQFRPHPDGGRQQVQRAGQKRLFRSKAVSLISVASLPTADVPCLLENLSCSCRVLLAAQVGLAASACSRFSFSSSESIYLLAAVSLSG